MSSPILIIDHGSSVAKTCLIKGNELATNHIPLGFKASEHLSVLESIIYIIRRVEALENIKILDNTNKPKIPVYLSGDVASTELEDTFGNLPISGVDALRALNMGIIDVGHGFTYVRFFSETFQSDTSEGDLVKKEVETLFLSGFASRRSIELEKILTWVPFDFSPIWIKNYLENKVLYPQIIPQSKKELRVEQALAKEKIADALASVDLNMGEIWQEEQNLLATGGVLSGAPRREQVVLIILDGVKPKRTLRIYWDSKQLAPCIGTLKFFDQKAGEELLRRIDFDCLATAVNVPVGSSIKIDFGLKNIQELRVTGSELLLFPLEKGKQAELSVETPDSEKFTCLIEGGDVGLVIDARGRPLERPPMSSKGKELLNSWEKALSVGGKMAEI